MDVRGGHVSSVAVLQVVDQGPSHHVALPSHSAVSRWENTGGEERVDNVWKEEGLERATIFCYSAWLLPQEGWAGGLWVPREEIKLSGVCKTGLWPEGSEGTEGTLLVPENCTAGFCWQLCRLRAILSTPLPQRWVVSSPSHTSHPRWKHKCFKEPSSCQINMDLVIIVLKG